MRDPCLSQFRLAAMSRMQLAHQWRVPSVTAVQRT
jgi:hypothetical protein